MKMKKIMSLVLALVMVASLAATLDITASAGKAKPQTSTYLDLESSTTDIISSHAIDQNYNLTVSNGNYTDVTKVKVDWTISSIDATRTEAKIWDPDTLSWKDDTSKTADEATAGTGKFTFTNLSSAKVLASVSFKAESGFNPTVTSTANEITLGTVVMSDKSVDSTAVHSASITMTVTPDAIDFKSAQATTGSKYGTYIVTLGKADTETALVAGAYFKDGETQVFLTWDEVLKAENGTKYDYSPELISGDEWSWDNNKWKSPFSYCKNLVSIVIPANYTTLCKNAFDGCSNLESVVFLNNTTTTLSMTMFQHCSKLKNVVLPSSLTTIPEYLFNYCTALESLTIPAGVNKISNCAFNSVTKCTVNYPGTISEWNAITKVTYWNNLSDIKVVCTDGSYTPLANIKFKSYDVTMPKNSSAILVAVQTPAVNDQSEIIWSSSNTDVATVVNGVVTTGSSAGTATIKCISVVNPNIYGYITVKIEKDLEDYKASATECTGSNCSILNIDIDSAFSVAKYLATKNDKKVYLIYYKDCYDMKVHYVSSADTTATDHTIALFDFEYEFEDENPAKDSATEILCYVPQ